MEQRPIPQPHELKPWQFLAFDLRLDLDLVDDAEVGASLLRLEQQHIRITTLARERERNVDALRRAYELHCRCHRNQPPVEMRQTPVPYHLWAWVSLESRDEALPDAYFLAVGPRGRYLGLSTAARLPRLPGALDCRFTGVLPEFGGRGVARALKAAVIRYALAHAYGELRSTVLADNHAMLRVNESLGFVRHRQFVQSYPQMVTPQLVKPAQSLLPFD